MSHRHSVYLAYDEGGTLLYVGRSSNWAVRWAQHSRRAGFFGETATLGVEWYETEELAARREAELIRDERPIWNVRQEGLRSPFPAPALLDIWECGESPGRHMLLVQVGPHQPTEPIDRMLCPWCSLPMWRMRERVPVLLESEATGTLEALRGEGQVEG